MAESTLRIWSVGDLCHAVADALEARFNPVAVRGELSGFSRAASGHCYFSLKDASGQLRCAMFKRAAGLLDFVARDGDLVEVRGRLGVYEPRGDLQLIVESMRQAGAGTLFEEFLKRKARLQAEGLFDAQRKRPLPVVPRAIGVVTSLGAAALHDVVTALQRRLPHVPVLVAPAAVQGAQAPAQLVQALESLYRLIATGVSLSGPGTSDHGVPVPDLILLVRGGGSMEDLWAFNDEALARAIVRSPVPVVILSPTCGHRLRPLRRSWWRHRARCGSVRWRCSANGCRRPFRGGWTGSRRAWTTQRPGWAVRPAWSPTNARPWYPAPDDCGWRPAPCCNTMAALASSCWTSCRGPVRGPSRCWRSGSIAVPCGWVCWIRPSSCNGVTPGSPTRKGIR